MCHRGTENTEKTLVKGLCVLCASEQNYTLILLRYLEVFESLQFSIVIQDFILILVKFF